jgi:hypothetical protein
MKTIYSVLYFLLLASGVVAQIPKLNSYPEARATVYLDFDGELVQGSAWNWQGPINALPAAVSSTGITEIFARVAEDYRIFNLNVTTDSAIFAAAPLSQRIRIIVTPTYQWYAPAGGVSFVGSFTWGDNTPAWVFSGLLGNNVKNIAEAISHEAGHTLGLQHQSTYNDTCKKVAEYASGQGSGEIGWAPIMGVGYSKNLTTWANGTNAVGCNIYQNDIAIIAGSTNNFGLRTDDHANAPAIATEVTITAGNFTAEGLVNTDTDKDVFKFVIPSPTNFRLNAIPQNVGGANAGANVDIRVSVLNAQADTIGRYNPTDLLNAGLDSNLNSGTYYLVVEGVGNTNLSDYGSVGFYSLAGSIGSILPLHRFIVTGANEKNTHTLSWNYTADENIKHIEVQYSKDGTRFTTLARLSETEKSFSWKPIENYILYYRVKAVTVADERAYYSNMLTMQQQNSSTLKVISNMITSQVTVLADKDYSYQLIDETGRLLTHGRMRTGINHIETTTAHKGLLLLRVQAGNESNTFKLIKQ